MSKGLNWEKVNREEKFKRANKSTPKFRENKKDLPKWWWTFGKYSRKCDKCKGSIKSGEKFAFRHDPKSSACKSCVEKYKINCGYSKRVLSQDIIALR